MVVKIISHSSLPNGPPTQNDHRIAVAESLRMEALFAYCQQQQGVSNHVVRYHHTKLNAWIVGPNHTNRVAYLSQEYLPQGDLFCFLQYNRGPNHGGLQWVRMGENLCRSLLLSMVDGLRYVH